MSGVEASGPSEAGMLPCPFCGGEAHYIRTDDRYHRVQCGHCGATRGEIVDTSQRLGRKAAMAHWNNRAALIAAVPELAKVVRLRAALEAAVEVADEARDEWDAMPSGMKAGKLLIALSGRLPGYRADIDAIHAARAASVTE